MGAVEVTLSLDLLRSLLHLPDDYEIVQVCDCNLWSKTFKAMVQSENLPKVNGDVYPPEAQIEYTNGTDGTIKRVRFITNEYPAKEIIEVYDYLQP